MPSLESRAAVFGVLGGYGATGSIVVSELARRRIGIILIGGRDRSRAEALAMQFDNAKAYVVDAREPAQVDAFCAQCRIVINCAGPIVEIGSRVAEAAFRQRCHYVDPGGFGIVLRALKSLEAEMRRQKLCFVLSAGWIPGLSEVLVRYADQLAAQYLEDPGMLNLYLGDSSDWSNTGFRDIAWHSRHRMWRGLRYFGRGRARLPVPWKLTRTVNLPPLGQQRVYLYSGHELERFARERHPGLTAYVGNLSLRTLATLALAALLPRSADQRAARWIRAAFQQDYNTRLKQGFAVIQVEDRSPASGRSIMVRLLVDRHYWITGLVPAQVAAMLADGQPVEPGAHFLGDAVDSAAFLRLLADCGVVPEVILSAGSDSR